MTDTLCFFIRRRKMKHKKYNFASGNVLPKLIRYAVPLLLANLLQSLYSIVDLLVVGRFVGEIGLAAISNASMVSFIINSFCIGITTGGTVLVAQYQGANDKERQNETVSTLFLVTLVSSVVITVVSLLTYLPVFQMLHVPAEAMREACAYMRIICMGTLFVFGYQAVCSILKGFGDSKRPLYFMIIATIANVILDFILVGPAELGTEGAGYATIISQATAFAAAIIDWKRREHVMDVSINSLRIRKEILKRLLVIGLPTAAQMVIVNVSYLLITGMLNWYGVSVAAASGIGLKINTFAGMPCWAIGQALTAMVGQNMGAKKYDRVRDITKKGLYMNIAVTFFVVLFVQLFAEPLIQMFHTGGEEVLSDGVLYLRICCSVNSLIYAAMYTFDSFAIGADKANIAMGNAFLDAAIVRILASWLLAFVFGYGFMGIYIGQALSPILPAILGLMYFKSNLWIKNR